MQEVQEVEEKVRQIIIQAEKSVNHDEEKAQHANIRKLREMQIQSRASSKREQRCNRKVSRIESRCNRRSRREKQ